MFTSTSALSLCLLLTIGFSTVHGQDDESTSGNSSRIVGGTNTQSSPTYVVSIQRIQSSGKAAHICAGVAIDGQYVLTAGTCVDSIDPTELRVLAGVSNLGSTMGSSYAVASYMVNSELSRGNNIAVVRVKPALILDPQISVANIPTDSARPESGLVYIYGWGRVDPAAMLPTLPIKQLATNIYSYSSCQRVYTNLAPNALCMDISLGKGTCLGDEGGPVILASTHQMIGIISYSAGHCGSCYPDVATLVSPSANFINGAMQSLSSACTNKESVAKEIEAEGVSLMN